MIKNIQQTFRDNLDMIIFEFMEKTTRIYFVKTNVL